MMGPEQLSWDGVFALQENVVALEKMMPKAPRCKRCEHKLSEHCAGGVRHSTYKDQARMVKHPVVSTCTTRHCEAPICSCTDYQELQCPKD